MAAIIWIPGSISRINRNCLLFSEIFDKSTHILLFESTTLKHAPAMAVVSKAQDFLMGQDYLWCSLCVLANGLKDPSF